MRRMESCRRSGTGRLADRGGGGDSWGMRAYLGMGGLSDVDEIDLIGNAVSKQCAQPFDGLLRVEAFLDDLGEFCIELLGQIDRDPTVRAVQSGVDAFLAVAGVTDRADQQPRK